MSQNAKIAFNFLPDFSIKLEKDPSKDLKMRKLNDTEKFT